MKKLFSFLIASILFVSSVFADQSEIKKLVNSKYYDELVKNGSVKIFHKTNEMDLVLLPSSVYKSKINAGRVKKTNKAFLFESLFYLKKDDLIKSSNSNDKDLNISDASRIMRSISSMQGITYYSNSKKKDRILYDKAYTISDPSSKTAVPDKNTGSADGKELYCLLNDASFGITRYKLNYSQCEKELYTTFTTTDAFGVGLITGIKPGDLRINILVIDCGDSFLLYLAPDANCIDFPGIDKKIQDSLIARMDSIYKWFIKQF